MTEAKQRDNQHRARETRGLVEWPARDFTSGQ
jgi:hypothetical protein